MVQYSWTTDYTQSPCAQVAKSAQSSQPCSLSHTGSYQIKYNVLRWGRDEVFNVFRAWFRQCKAWLRWQGAWLRGPRSGLGGAGLSKGLSGSFRLSGTRTVFLTSKKVKVTEHSWLSDRIFKSANRANRACIQVESTNRVLYRVNSTKHANGANKVNSFFRVNITHKTVLPGLTGLTVLGSENRAHICC